MKTTLATIASVEARLPVQAQQILRQVSQGGKNTPQPGKKKKAVKQLWNQGRGNWSLKALFPSLVSMPPSFHLRRLAASRGRSCATLHSTCTGSDRRWVLTFVRVEASICILSSWVGF